MRRTSFHRPKQKVRNPERHIRTLKAWAEEFRGYYPERDDEQYTNFKIWTLDRFVQGSSSKFEWQKEALEQLFVAANHMVNAKPDNEQGKSWVAVLLCYPNLFASEVTVFFDETYYKRFRPDDGLLLGRSILAKYEISASFDYIELGYKEDWGDEEESIEVEMWTIGEPSL